MCLTLLCLTTINNASLPTLPIPPSSSTSINHMIAPLLAFGGGYKTATIQINYVRKNNAPVIPYLLKALSAGLISVGGLVCLGKEPSYSEQTFYASTFVLGALMGARSSNFGRQLTTTQDELLTTQDQLNNQETYFKAFEKDLAWYQNHLPSTLMYPSKQSEYEERNCTVCTDSLLESEYALIKLKCGHLFHQPCINP